MKTKYKVIVAATVLLATLNTFAQEAAIRKNLAERIPRMPAIEAVTKSPVAGLYEVTLAGSEIIYTDADGSHMIRGQMIDTKQQRNLTQERIDKLTAINFAALPFKDAFTIVRGDGKRKLAVFEDPNCGYCKRFERDLQKINNVTVYLFLYPILGSDSREKSNRIWCAKDKGATWQDWMVRDKPPGDVSCSTAALDRNVEFGSRYKITGTPTLIFADGSRVPGALSDGEVEARLASAQAK
jgi:thiol:disulfide interchange protein DsbC